MRRVLDSCVAWVKMLREFVSWFGINNLQKRKHQKKLGDKLVTRPEMQSPFFPPVRGYIVPVCLLSLAENPLELQLNVHLQSRGLKNITFPRDSISIFKGCHNP